MGKIARAPHGIFLKKYLFALKYAYYSVYLKLNEPFKSMEYFIHASFSEKVCIFLAASSAVS